MFIFLFCINFYTIHESLIIDIPKSISKNMDKINQFEIKESFNRIFIEDQSKFHIFTENGSYINTYKLSINDSWISNFTPIPERKIILLSIVIKVDSGYIGSTIFIDWNGNYLGAATDRLLSVNNPSLQEVHFRQVEVLDNGELIANIWNQDESSLDFRKIEIETHNDNFLIVLSDSLYHREFDRGSHISRNKYFHVSGKDNIIYFIHPEEYIIYNSDDYQKVIDIRSHITDDSWNILDFYIDDKCNFLITYKSYEENLIKYMKLNPNGGIIYKGILEIPEESIIIKNNGLFIKAYIYNEVHSILKINLRDMNGC